MKTSSLSSVVALGLMLTFPLSMGEAGAQEPPKVKIPEPGVPQIMTMEGRFVRAAYNNEGYAILGYRLANDSVGEEWMLLEVGLTVRKGVPDYTLTRDGRRQLTAERGQWQRIVTAMERMLEEEPST